MKFYSPVLASGKTISAIGTGVTDLPLLDLFFMQGIIPANVCASHAMATIRGQSYPERREVLEERHQSSDWAIATAMYHLPSLSGKQ